MNILTVSPEALVPSRAAVSVGIVDSGFREIPPYAVVHGPNPRPRHPHGNRVLGVFAAPDAAYPIPGLTLHLASYDEGSTYSGLLSAIDVLPACDILSISIAWRDNRQDIRKMLLGKAGVVLVAFSSHTSTPYPSRWGDAFQSCSQVANAEADWSIRPSGLLDGNSYSVPAVARLMAYGNGVSDGGKDGIPVGELFSASGAVAEKYYENRVPASRQFNDFTCAKCGRRLLDENHNPMQELPARCPYCGRNPSRGATV